MFPNLQEVTDTARVNRAIERLKTCTVDVDLDRVWRNCQPLCDHLHAKAKAGSQEAATLLKRLADVSCDVRQSL